MEEKKKSEKAPVHQQIIDQRKTAVKHILESIDVEKKTGGEWVRTGIEGLDELFEKGIPKGASVLVCGGPGSGKTIFCLQTLAYAASQGEKCLYMTFEESPERLKQHMRDFGWDADDLERKGMLKIQKFNPFDITRQVEAMLEEQRGELLIDVKPMLFPAGFIPERIAVDSLSAIASAFVGKEETYRIYIEQLFRIFQDINATSFMISESTDVVRRLTVSGVEEFLADGVIVLYTIRKGTMRANAVEVLKLRGAGFQKRVVAMSIVPGKGIAVYPEQEMFSEV